MAPKKRFDITPELLEELHYDKMLTPQEIADKYGCSRSLVYHYFRKFGIKKRPKNYNLLNKRFGYLVVKEFLGINNQRQAEWRCACDCGNETIATTGQLNHGLKSCGCFAIDKATTHGMSDTRPYSIWLGMKSRCDNPNTFNYADYGGRGISYCPDWAAFESFWRDMRDNYSDHKTLDRIDNDKDYGPKNCRWATTKQQNNNKSNCVIITHNGQSLNAAQWANKLDVPRYVIYSRHRGGWSDKKIIETPYTPR